MNKRSYDWKINSVALAFLISIIISLTIFTITGNYGGMIWMFTILIMWALILIIELIGGKK